MHYKKLLEAHKAFYKEESRAYYYDEYMKCKDWKSWTSSVPICEIMKLFGFILSWDPNFQGDLGKFKKIYEEIYPFIKELEHTKLQDVDFTDEDLKKKIQNTFDKMARCPRKLRYESTDASKILHTILPEFFVMWDDKIRQGILEGKRKGRDYAYEFLPKVQRELEEAIKTCMDERKSNRTKAIREISERCDGKTLSKLADEFNYMKYTMRWKDH